MSKGASPEKKHIPVSFTSTRVIHDSLAKLAKCQNQARSDRVTDLSIFWVSLLNAPPVWRPLSYHEAVMIVMKRDKSAAAQIVVDQRSGRSMFSSLETVDLK